MAINLKALFVSTIDGIFKRVNRITMTRELGLVILIVLLFIVASLAYPSVFPTYDNIAAILRNLALDGVMATGTLLLLVGGVFDLSIGAMFSMGGVVIGWMLKDMGMPLGLALIGALIMVALGGLLNGFLVAKVGVNALITTLGTMQIFRGIAILFGGPGIVLTNYSEFINLGQSNILGLQTGVWLMIIVVILFLYLLSKTRYFRQFYYIGGNEKAAELSGINVQRMKILGFVIMAILAGLSGIAFAARLGSAVSRAGDGKELQIITAVILGGASLQGGKGTVWGALAGVIFIALINNVMIIANVSTYWQSIVIGVILIMAVAADSIFTPSKSNRRKEMKIKKNKLTQANDRQA